MVFTQKPTSQTSEFSKICLMLFLLL